MPTLRVSAVPQESEGVRAAKQRGDPPPLGLWGLKLWERTPPLLPSGAALGVEVTRVLNSPLPPPAVVQPHNWLNHVWGTSCSDSHGRPSWSSLLQH